MLVNQRLVTIRAIIEVANSFGGGSLQAATTCRVWTKNPDLPAFQNMRIKKRQKWNGEMDCNRFSGPMCPLKFRDVCAEVSRLSPTFANSSRHDPSISTAHSCSLARENTCIHGNFHPRRRFFYPPTLRLAACIPRIIRILQLLHRTILTNKRHVVITSGTQISSPPQSFLVSVARLIPPSRWKTQSSRVYLIAFLMIKSNNCFIFEK